MRSLGTAVGAGALLVALVGCASSTSTPVGAEGGPTLTTSASPTAPASEEPEFDSPVPPDGTEVPRERVDASTVPEDVPKVVWTEGDGSTLGVIAQEAGCGKASVEVAAQGAEAVEVVLVETTSPAQEVCTMDIRYPPLTAELDAPLGDRRVVLTTRQDTE
jgi:hypothetical protein